MTYTKKKIAVDMKVPDGATHYEMSYNQIRFLKVKNNRWFLPGETKWIETKMSDTYLEYLTPIEVCQ